MLKYERITIRNVKAFLKLSIPPEQRKLLYTSNLKTLFQSVIWARYSKLFLILDGKQAVGYVFLYCYTKTKKYNVGRLLIDHRFQNRGFGRETLLWSVDYLKKRGAPRILLSVHPENYAARRLYENVGFAYCENHYWGDEMVMKHT